MAKSPRKPSQKPKRTPEVPTYPKGGRNTVPLPPEEAERLAEALRKQKYRVELRAEGSQVSIAYAPPIWKSGKRALQFDTIVKRLWPENSGGAFLQGQARLPV